MNIEFSGSELSIDDRRLMLQWRILDAFSLSGIIIVLFDPDAYLLDPSYKLQRRLGCDAIRNLCAFSYDGSKIWEADFPEKTDYYYAVYSKSPLLVNSFSSFRCEIDPTTGRISSKVFMK